MTRNRGLTSLEILTILVVLGLFAMLSLSRMPGMFEAQIRSRTSRAKTDMRNISTAVAEFQTKHEKLPESKPLAGLLSGGATLEGTGGSDLSTYDPAILASPLLDPFSPDRQLPYAYFANGDSWLLVSAGSDRDYDIQSLEGLLPDEDGKPTPKLVDLTYDPTNGTKSDGDIYRWGPEAELKTKAESR